MTGRMDFRAILARIDELYRPSLRGHWRRRVLNRLQTWVDRADLTLHWADDEEQADQRAERVALPARDRAPRWLIFEAPLDPVARDLALQLAPHVGRVATLMEGNPDSDVPQRWQDQLTPRQLQVALLAANGASNEDVAEELGIAPRTVARQLQEVFRRLDVSNRAALAAECALGRPPTPFYGPGDA